MDLSQLKKEIPFKWRIQSRVPRDKNKPAIKFQCVAYIDSRQVMDLLDEVVTPSLWQNKFEVIGKNLYCHAGINIDGQWVWKSDTGIESNIEPEKGQASDAFKRAWVHWGIGRFLYSLPILELPAKQYNGGNWYPYFEKQKKMLFNNDEVAAACNYIYSQQNKSK